MEAEREAGPLRGLVLAEGLWGTTEFATVGAREATLGAGGAAWYEVTLLRAGKYVQLGWAAWPASFTPVSVKGVGDDDASWAADGLRQILFHGKKGSRRGWEVSWRDGDVIGVAADLRRRTVSFAHNGEWHESFSDVDAATLWPAVSGGPGAIFRINLGAEPFRHAPPDPGYAPLLHEGEGGIAPIRGRLVRGGDPMPPRNPPPEGTTALHLCCLRGRLQNARALVAAGASVGRANAAGATPLALASAGGHTDLVRFLLEAEPPAAAAVELARTLARERGRTEVVSVLDSVS